MLRLEEINGKNVWDTLKLRVPDDRKNFVASNGISITGAYAMISGNGYAFPFAVYNADVSVEFLTIGSGVNDCWDSTPKIAQGNYNLWRLMTDRNYQGRGFGRKAIQLTLNFIKTFSCGATEYCWPPYEPESDVARQLYSSLGFVETGDKDGEGVITALKLWRKTKSKFTEE